MRSVVEARIEGLGQRLEASAGRETALLSTIEGLRGQLERVRAEGEASTESSRLVLEKVQNLIEFQGNRIVQLEERIREAGALVAAGVVPAVPVASSGGAVPPAWGVHLGNLQDPDAALRLDSVSHLAESKDPEVVPHILPLLADSDLFVRMVVAQTLGDLEAKVGVSSLIDRLEDESVTVREAAVISLRRITNQSFGFEPDALEIERRKRVSAWRSWWRKAGDDFLTS